MLRSALAFGASAMLLLSLSAGAAASPSRDGGEDLDEEDNAPPVDLLAGIVPVPSEPFVCDWPGHPPGITALTDGSDATYCVWSVRPAGTWIRFPLSSPKKIARFRVFMPCAAVPEDANRPGHPPAVFEIWVGSGTDLTTATKVGDGASTCDVDPGFVSVTQRVKGTAVFYRAAADCDIAPACDAALATVSALSK